MNENNGRKRNVWSYILSYGFIIVFVVLMVWLLVSRCSNRNVTTLAESTLTSHVLKRAPSADQQASIDDGSKTYYYIYSAEVSSNYSTTTVTGYLATAPKSGEKSKIANSYKFIVMNERWGLEKFDITYDGTTETIEGWYSYFADSIDACKASYGKSGSIVNVDPFQESWFEKWGPTLLSLGITIIIGLLFFRMFASSVNGANRQAMDFNKSPARRESSKVRFADVAGCDEEKAEMVEMVEYLKEPRKYSQFGARLPKGVLLIGHPGTGKTLLAKAVAGEAGVPFYSISGSDFVEMFVGVGAGRVRDLFKKAKQTAPCIVFIDEIDAVGRQRGAGLGGGNDEREQTLNQLLVEMDGFEYNSGILVMAATNRDDVLDPALLRPGRFDRIITVSLPDKKGREAIFKVHARNKKIGSDVDFAALSQRTVGFSGADIENILNEAAILAVRFHKDEISMAEIDEAIDRRIAGPAKSSRAMSEAERKQVAYHEAGHSLIGIVLPHSQKVQKITIIPRGNTGGHVLMTPEADKFLETKNELLAEITGLLGGRVSEEIFFEDISTGASNDIEKATKLARMMVTEWGMSDLGPIQYEQASGSVFLGRDYTNSQKNFSSEIAFEIDKAVREIIDSCHEEARKIITEHKDQVTLIAETLLAQETITAEEIESLVKDGKLPEKEKAVEVKEETKPEEPVVEEKSEPSPEEEKPAEEEKTEE